MPKVFITKEFSFEAAHHLLNYDGACANVHGHSYKLKVTVSGNIDPANTEYANDCMIMDFKDLNKLVMNHIIHTHDHADLNDLYSNPTAEIMVIGIFNTIQYLLPKDVKLECVKLWETATSYAEYRGDSHE